jgi:hypothetical protein
LFLEEKMPKRKFFKDMVSTTAFVARRRHLVCPLSAVPMSYYLVLQAVNVSESIGRDLATSKLVARLLHSRTRMLEV